MLRLPPAPAGAGVSEALRLSPASTMAILTGRSINIWEHRMPLKPGETFPALTWPAVDGGDVSPMADDGWRILIVYRGKHCPICREYLKTLNAMLADFEKADFKVYTVSADPIEKAGIEAAEEDWRFPVGHDLSVDQMRQLGLYVSTPRSPEETDRPFAEPAAFVIDGEGKTHMVAVSNAAFARPELGMLLKGLTFVRDEKFPIRGLGLRANDAPAAQA